MRESSHRPNLGGPPTQPFLTVSARKDRRASNLAGVTDDEPGGRYRFRWSEVERQMRNPESSPDKHDT